MFVFACLTLLKYFLTHIRVFQYIFDFSANQIFSQKAFSVVMYDINEIIYIFTIMDHTVFVL